MKKQIIILAAGKGSRMNSDLPKVMHLVDDKPMLRRVVDNCAKITDDLVLVYSDHIEDFLPQFTECKLSKQRMQLGTAHAVAAAFEHLDDNKVTGVIYGDNPLITDEIISGLFDHLHTTESALVTLAFHQEGPNQYGKIIVDANGEFIKIIEHKFASEEEKKIKLCNSGIMAFAPGILSKYIPACLQPNSQNPERELYLTDIVEICSNQGEKVSFYTPDNSHLVIGVNTQEELVAANMLVNNTQ